MTSSEDEYQILTTYYQFILNGYYPVLPWLEVDWSCQHRESHPLHNNLVFEHNDRHGTIQGASLSTL